MYILAKRLLPITKDSNCASTDRASRNKNSEQSAYNQIRSAILFFACQTDLSCFFWKEISDIFFSAQSFSLRRLLHSVYSTYRLQRAYYQSLFKNMISVHTLERLLMFWTDLDIIPLPAGLGSETA